MDRRDALKTLAATALFTAPGPLAAAQAAARRGMPPLKIKDVKVIQTQPAGSQLVMRKEQKV